MTAIDRGLVENDCATIVMACGTGKSLVALWAAEQHDCKNLLVLVPSLALVRQLLHEWLKETVWEQLTFMCVCSDPTVTKGADDLIVHQADLDFPITTESAAVSRFLSKPFDGVKIVFSTYQSAQVVADGMPVDADGMAQPFDLAVFDEAHKTASRDGTRFSFALEDTNLPIRKRLFFTATPRHYDIRKKDKEGDNTLVYSMDKPEIYGPVVHTLSFAEAARRGIICDYKVVISVVTSAMVNDHLLQHGKVIVDGDTVKARQVALQIALQKAVEKYGVSRIFTFHGSVAAARSFTSEDGEGIRNHLPDFTTLHVSGEMRTSLREDQMKVFRQANNAVMSNARCLTEGVDVPAVDMVAFISPRKSKVDIVQATGRAMRKSPGKVFGYVMVPLFVEQAADESIEEALERTGFSDIWDLLGAMKEQDDVLTDIIRQMREDKGRTGGYDESRFSERVEVLGPNVVLDTIRGSITAECLEYLGASWDEWFGRLHAFSESKGHCRVPKTYDDRRLSNWVTTQRFKKGNLTANRIDSLERLQGWTWDPFEESWELGFDYLWAFIRQEGHAHVKGSYKTEDGYSLGFWVINQRQKRDKLPPDRKARLDALNEWIWDVHDEQWEEGFGILKEFSKQQGHTLVAGLYVTETGFRLGRWVSTQRKVKFKMPLEQQAKLESLPQWTWDVSSGLWEKGFEHLKAFTEKEGHSRAPSLFVTTDGYHLGIWTQKQRGNRNNLAKEQKDRLEALPGWSWDLMTYAWGEGFSHLQDFLIREGHSRVPAMYVTEEGYKLGQWTGVQRKTRYKMPPDRQERLSSLAGWTWNAIDYNWEAGFANLQEYARQEGHTKVPQDYETEQKFPLGQWVSVQRRMKSKKIIPAERIERLEALPGWAWNRVAIKWVEGYRHLKEFIARENHCKVPATFRTRNGYRLGTWVFNQRNLADKEKLSPERIALLNEINFIWSSKDEI